MSKSLSSLSAKFRESLLRRNLSVGDISVPNTGLTREIGEYNPTTNESSVLSISNIKSVQANLAYNRYSFEDVMQHQQQPSEPIIRYNGSETYLDTYDLGSEETGKIKAFNMIGSVLNGTGVGWNGNGFEDTFDVRSSLAGRILSATGVIKDTPLGMIANRELVKAMVNRVMFSTQKETLGRINIDPINAIKGGDIIRNDYSITIGHDFGTKALETLEDLTGINLPFSQLSPDASISIRGYSQALIKNTGKGQVQELFFNLNENYFGPDYEDKRIKNVSLEGKFSYQEATSFFKGIAGEKDDYDNISPEPLSLLGKTQRMFKSNGFSPLHKEQSMLTEKSEVTNTTTFGATEYMSKGSGVLNKEALRGVPDENGNIFGRVFTKDNPYNQVKNLQKRTGLAYKDSATDSVLDSNGFIRVSPNKNDIMEGKDNIKNFMFSIENLAWHNSDNFNDLAPSEVGPGDLVTGTKGRIMWFPPYDISFSEVTSVNWETTQFIGRGEPIYTYNNTERVGSLDFKVIMDYPSYMEDLKGLASDDLFRAIAAGVEDMDYSEFKNLAPNEVKNLEVATVVKPQEIIDNKEPEIESFELYYDHEVVDGYQAYGPDNYSSQVTFAFYDSLTEKLKSCPSCVINIKGYSSYDEDEYTAFSRAATMREIIKTKLPLSTMDPHPITISPKINGTNQTGCQGPEYASNSDCKRQARKVVLDFEYNPARNKSNTQIASSTPPTPQRDLSPKLKKRFINEALYFEKLSEENPLVYESISESIKHFHPAFHSITPEGFNSRLNFLQQCTRQGPTQGEAKANNLAFGKPPVCILRLGDFYHTKIVIDSVNLTFEDHQWDLNPEGAGVQPMIAKVSLSFKFIGGSSLKGPINKLQNAVAFNFFANSEVYDDRADKIVKVDNGEYMYNSDVQAELAKRANQTPAISALERGDVEFGDPLEPNQKETGEYTTDELFANISFDLINLDEDTGRFTLTLSKNDTNMSYDPPITAKVRIIDHVTDTDYFLGDKIVFDEQGFSSLVETPQLKTWDTPEDWDFNNNSQMYTVVFIHNGVQRSVFFPQHWNQL